MTDSETENVTLTMTTESVNNESMRSLPRQQLWDRTMENRDISTEFKTKISISGLSLLLKMMRKSVDWAQFVGAGSVDWAQFVGAGRKGTLPAVPGSIITKVKVKRIALSMHTHTETQTDAMMNAEFIINKKSSEDAKKRCILYMHGGAYVLSSRRTHRGITSRLALYADSTVFAIDYRLAPQHVFPAPLADVLSAYRYLIQNGFDPSNICFSGDSSGGGLSTAAMLYCRDSQRTESPIPMPGCIAVMSPYNDMTQSLPSWYLNEKYCYLPEALSDKKYFTETRHAVQVAHDTDLTHIYASPIMAHSNPSIPICPTLIQVGDAERVRDDSIYFATQSMLPNEPIAVELYADAGHVFQLFAAFDGFSDHALVRMGRFVRDNTAVSRSNVAGCVRGCVKVLNAPGWPTVDVPDLDGILSDGVRLCVMKGLWTMSKDGNTMYGKHSIA